MNESKEWDCVCQRNADRRHKYVYELNDLIKKYSKLDMNLNEAIKKAKEEMGPYKLGGLSII